MENSLQLVPEMCDDEGELVHELPREEALVRLYELAGRYAGGQRVPCPVQAERDVDGLQTPHAFGFGCCASAARPSAA